MVSMPVSQVQEQHRNQKPPVGMSDKELGTLKEVIRSLLIADKEPVPLTRFLSDYEEIEGCAFPFKKFKHDSPVSFLETLSDAVRVLRLGGQVCLTPQVTKEVEHVREKVLNQKTSSKGHQKRQHSYQAKYNGSQNGRFCQWGGNQKRQKAVHAPPGYLGRRSLLNAPTYSLKPAYAQPYGKPQHMIPVPYTRPPRFLNYPQQTLPFGLNGSAEHGWQPIPPRPQKPDMTRGTVFQNSRPSLLHRIPNWEKNCRTFGFESNDGYVSKIAEGVENKNALLSESSKHKPVEDSSNKCFNSAWSANEADSSQTKAKSSTNVQNLLQEATSDHLATKELHLSSEKNKHLKLDVLEQKTVEPVRESHFQEPALSIKDFPELREPLAEASLQTTETKRSFNSFSKLSSNEQSKDQYSKVVQKSNETKKDTPESVPFNSFSKIKVGKQEEPKNHFLCESKQLHFSGLVFKPESYRLSSKENSQGTSQVQVPEKRTSNVLNLGVKPFRIIPEVPKKPVLLKPNENGIYSNSKHTQDSLADSTVNSNVWYNPVAEKNDAQSENSLSSEASAATNESAKVQCNYFDNEVLLKINKVLKWLDRNDHSPSFSYTTFKDNYEEITQEVFTKDVNRILQKLPGIKIRGGFIFLEDFYREQYLIEPHESSPINDAISSTDDHYIQQELPESYMCNSLDHFIEVQVTEVINPGHFYVLLLGNDTSNQLWTLMDNMNSYYAKSENNISRERLSIKIGKPCAANFPPSASVNDMHRAVIKNILNEKMVEIEYVDFGTVRSIHIDYLKEIPDIFLSLRKQAIRVKLFQTFPKDSKGWNPDATQRLFDLVTGKTIRCCFMEKSGDVYPVLLCDTNGPADTFIHLQLEREGYVNVDHNMDNMLQDFCPSPKIIEIEQLNSEQSLHIIFVEDKHYISSQDLAQLFACSSTEMEKRLSPLNFTPRVLTKKEHPALFKYLQDINVPGIYNDKLHVFELCSAYVILTFLQHPDKFLLSKVKTIAEKYTTDCSVSENSDCVDEDLQNYTLSDCANLGSDNSEPEDIEKQFDELKSRRLACLKLLTTNPTNTDDLVREIDHLERELNYLSLRFQGEDRGTADGSCEPFRRT